jgi:hypothetical protein
MTASSPHPVLVLAPPRSCSTVVTAMLGSHPQIFALPEMKLFRRATVAEIVNNWPTARNVPLTRRRAGLVRGLAQVHAGDQSAQSVSEALTWLQERQTWTGAEVLEHLRQLVAPQTLVEKSPENCGRDEYLDRLLATAPDTRLIHLVRHPLAMAASLGRAWAPPAMWGMADSVRHQFNVGTWLFHHERIETALRSLPATQWRSVRAEDVINTPTETLPALCEWIGVSAAPEAIAAMRRTERWEFASPGPSNAVGGGDSLFHDDPTLRAVAVPDDVAFPADWLIDPWTQVSVRSIAARYGYC